MKKNEEPPFFTVITACFNSEKTIKETINSLLGQTFSNFEYIIIDGNSTDNTLSIIKKFRSEFDERKIKFRWISEKDKGIYDAFNKGLAMAEGRWVSFVGSDDYYLENALQDYYKLILDNPNVTDLVYSNVEVRNNNRITKIIDGVWSWRVFRRMMNIAHVGAFHKKEYFERYGLFDDRYKIVGDYELLLRAKNKLSCHKLDKITAVMSDSGISNTEINTVFKETMKVKIESRSTYKIIGYLDYYVWIIKNLVKKVIYAFTR